MPAIDISTFESLDAIPKKKPEARHCPVRKRNIDWGVAANVIADLDLLDFASPKLVFECLKIDKPTMDDVSEAEIVAAVQSFAILGARGRDITLRLHGPFCLDEADQEVADQIAERIREIAIRNADPMKPRWRVSPDGQSFATLTDHGKAFFETYESMIKAKVAEALEARKTGKSIAIEASPMAPREHGSPEGLPTHDITPDPAKSILPAVALHETLPAIRATCRICEATRGLTSVPHDCRAYQI